MSAFDLVYADLIVLPVTDTAGVSVLELCPKLLAHCYGLLNTEGENSFHRVSKFEAMQRKHYIVIVSKENILNIIVITSYLAMTISVNLFILLHF